MSAADDFLVTLAEDLTEDDRVALDRPGFKLYPPGSQVSDAWFQGRERPPLHGRHWVRVRAKNSEDAKRQVTEVLGRTPEGLEAFGTRSS